MFRLSPRRNRMNTGFFKLKDALQIGILLGVCIWLICEVQQYHNRKASYEESTRLFENLENGNDIINLGRKDLQPNIKESQNEEARSNEGQGEEGNEEFHDETNPGEDHREDRVDARKETTQSMGKEMLEKENEKEKENDDNKNGGPNETKEEERVESEDEKSIERGEEDIETGSIYKDGEERDKDEVIMTEDVKTVERGEEDIETGSIYKVGEERDKDEGIMTEDVKTVERGEEYKEKNNVTKENIEKDKEGNSENDEEDAEKKIESDGEDKDNKDQSEKSKEKEKEETKGNGTQLDEGEKKELNQQQKNKTEENQKSEEETETEEGAPDVSVEGVMESQSMTRVEKGITPNTSGEEQSSKEQLEIETKNTNNTEANNVNIDNLGSVTESEMIEQNESSNITANEDRGNKSYQVESGDYGNLTEAGRKANEKNINDNSTTASIQIQKNTTNDIVNAGGGLQTVLKERNKNEKENLDLKIILAPMAGNDSDSKGSTDSSKNLEFSDANGENVKHDLAGGIASGAENSSGSEKNDPIKNQKANADSVAGAEEQIKPSNVNETTGSYQNKSEDILYNEETSSASNGDADAGRSDQGDSSSLLKKKKKKNKKKKHSQTKFTQSKNS